MSVQSHPVHLFPLTLEAIATCKLSLTETRDSKIIKAHRSFQNTSGCVKGSLQENVKREKPGQGPQVFSLSGLSAQHSAVHQLTPRLVGMSHSVQCLLPRQQQGTCRGNGRGKETQGKKRSWSHEGKTMYRDADTNP